MVYLSIAIPFYNESKNSSIILDKLSRRLKSSGIDYEIIAVNNGSVDDTPKVLTNLAKKDKRIKIATVEKNIGYGFGIKTGLEKAKGELIGYMWADDFAGAEMIPNLVSELEKSNAFLVKVKRLERNEGLYRKLQSAFYNTLFGIMFGIYSKDLNGCPKIMKNSFYKSIMLKSNDWFLDPEIMLELKRQGGKFVEVPYRFQKRIHGKSHVKMSTSLEFLKNMAKYKLGWF